MRINMYRPWAARFLMTHCWTCSWSRWADKTASALKPLRTLCLFASRIKLLLTICTEWRPTPINTAGTLTGLQTTSIAKRKRWKRWVNMLTINQESTGQRRQSHFSRSLRPSSRRWSTETQLNFGKLLRHPILMIFVKCGSLTTKKWLNTTHLKSLWASKWDRKLKQF